MNIFVAGVMCVVTPWDAVRATHVEESFGLEIAKRGHMPVIPHSLEAKFSGECDLQLWYNNLYGLLEACDALFLVPGWERSPFCNGAKAWAEGECKIPVYMAIMDIPMVKLESEKDSAK